MTVPTQDPTGSLALEMERLRGTVGVGISDIKGSLALLVQRTDQTDRTLGEHRDHLVVQDGRLARLERWMWLAIGVSATCGTIGGWLAGAYLH